MSSGLLSPTPAQKRRHDLDVLKAIFVLFLAPPPPGGPGGGSGMPFFLGDRVFLGRLRPASGVA